MTVETLFCSLFSNWGLAAYLADTYQTLQDTLWLTAYHLELKSGNGDSLQVPRHLWGDRSLE